MIKVNRYSDEDKEIWNEFNKKSKNYLFMFDRNYMDYHRDRFIDTKKQLRKKLGDSGLHIEYIGYFNFFLFFPAAVLKLLSKLTRSSLSYDVGNGYKDTFVNKLLYKIFRVEGKFINKGVRFPFVISVIAVCSCE